MGGQRQGTRALRSWGRKGTVDSGQGQFGQWTVGSEQGQWAVGRDSRQWAGTVDSGQWAGTVDSGQGQFGQWTVGSGQGQWAVGRTRMLSGSVCGCEGVNGRRLHGCVKLHVGCVGVHAHEHGHAARPACGQAVSAYMQRWERGTHPSRPAACPAARPPSRKSRCPCHRGLPGHTAPCAATQARNQLINSVSVLQHMCACICAPQHERKREVYMIFQTETKRERNREWSGQEMRTGR
eukprot:335739-Chlamydomonas_euryale.AAC.6